MMNDRDGIRFLQWALPRLGLRWPGFRKVRGQVLKRLGRRLAEMELASLDDYRGRLVTDPGEWEVLDRLCRVTISRFYRDRGLWDALGERVLPELARSAVAAGGRELRCWSCGCASGEEPYTLALVWRFALRDRFPDLRLDIMATDVDPVVLDRARQAVYPRSAVKELPVEWWEGAFENDGCFRLRSEFRDAVRFVRHDLRDGSVPEAHGIFHLILCRNLAFTYFDRDRQREVLETLAGVLAPGGVLAVGAHERLPDGPDFVPGPCAGLFRRG